jgi:hypothetical protein
MLRMMSDGRFNRSSKAYYREMTPKILAHMRLIATNCLSIVTRVNLAFSFCTRA